MIKEDILSVFSGLLFVFILLVSVSQPCRAGRIEADDLVYQGAFRLPEGSNGSDWNYSGQAMTYYPGGDSSGPDDGYPGSFFIIGHDHQQYVSEISIPVPVISTLKNPDELNTAETLQEFQEITGEMFGELEIPVAGIEYLPAQGSQTSGKLHFCWGEHFQDFEISHGWCETDLSNPQPAGGWYFGNYTNYVSNDYLFKIPEQWANTHAPGQLLATGRFREGGWSGRGPALFAFAPWNVDNPPAGGARIETITPLLLYGIQEPGIPEIVTDDSMEMENYEEADSWSGGAWLSVGGNSSVVFVGTKAVGSWYGFANGVVWPIDCEPPDCPGVPEYPYDNRGWWAEEYNARIIFYDTEELTRVVNGEMNPWEPQAYATLDINQYLFDPEIDVVRYKRQLVGAMCFDTTNSLLYVVERQADSEKSLVHVWKVAPSTSSTPAQANLVSPSGSVTNTLPTYTWNEVEEAGWYYLWINDASKNVFKQWYQSGEVVKGDGTCSVTPVFSLESGEHRWWIQTWNDNGYGNWSDEMNFTVNLSSIPDKAVLISPAGTQETSPLAFTWNEVEEAGWYYLWVNDASKNVFQHWYRSGEVVKGDGTCSVTPDLSLESGEHRWWIQTWNDNGYGHWSDEMNFVITMPSGGAITADHSSAAAFDNIPAQYLSEVRSSNNLYYGHTSHGSQIITGLSMLENENSTLYSPPAIYDDYRIDLGTSTWEDDTRNYLNAHSETSLVIWSWCGQLSWYGEAEVNDYLTRMSRLENDYPGVIFIYMTGHLDGTGPPGTLNTNNNLIRSYCSANGKVLFDFADIENYDPDGNFYADASDACEWCETWCTSNSCPDFRCNDSGCAHSHCYNCYIKGKAFWWLMARLAGWDGN